VLKHKKNCGLKKGWFLGIIVLFLPLQFLLGQERWIQVSNPVPSSNSFEVLGETYYKSPVQLQNAVHQNLLKEIRLPNEKGEEEVFLLTPTPVLSQPLALKYSKIKTYKGVSKFRPNVRIRLSIQPNGLSAWIQLDKGPDFFIQPVKGKKELYFTYTKSNRPEASPLFCKTKASLQKTSREAISSKRLVFNDSLRTFRIAVAVTGEYTAFWGDDDETNGSNAEDALGAIVSTINRINVIFERDLNIRLELVSDTNLIYEDSDTDPFTGDFSTELQKTLDEVLGNNAYDVGHLFDYGEPNGDAGCIGCVCKSGQKGQGYSIHPFRDIYGGEYRNDYFDLDYVGHEIGHQFGAYHTFSYETEGVGVNAEPGSGSTIMGYAGITGVDDLQQHGDSYFHFYSIKNISEYVATISCGTSEATELGSFSIDAGPDYFIPVGTPFELGIMPLPDGENYTYCWEQLDSAEITSNNFGPSNATGAMARSLPPSLQPFRTIPNLERVLSNELIQENPGINDAWETVPLVGRFMRWGLTVRKQSSDFNQIAQDEIELTVINNAGPFTITSQGEVGYKIRGGTLENISWNVAKTDQSPIGVSEVAILLSTDGGKTFPITLADGVSNSGTAQVFIPNEIDTTKGRIKIKPKNEIFFAINSTEFSIESRDLVLILDTYIKENCGQNTLQFPFEIQKASGFDKDFRLQINTLPSDVRVQFSKTVYRASDSLGFFTLSGLSNLAPDDYELNLEATFDNASETFPFIVQQRNEDVPLANLLQPQDGSEGVSLSPVLEWESFLNVDRSRVQLAKDSNFQTLVTDTLINASQLKLNTLEAKQLYYWRVLQQNNCGETLFSSSKSFETSPISCQNLSAAGLPKDLNDATDSEEGMTLATINIQFDAPILDLDVLVDIEHSWVEDLILYLEAPDERRYLLSSSLGYSGDNYTETLFDQEASDLIGSARPPFTGSYKPVQDISFLYGTSSKGLWKLIVIDQYSDDTGRLLEFELHFCLEGTIAPNRDNDTIPDSTDNCPEITNENQADIDGNGIGDVCDLFSAQNLSLVKKDSTCPDKENGSFTFNARAEFPYIAKIQGPNGFRDTVNFSTSGGSISNLAPGNYEICIYSDQFPDFEYCYETEIKTPERLDVQSFYNPASALLTLNLKGSDAYTITLNERSYELLGKNSIELPLTQKVNRIEVNTTQVCQGHFEQWINLETQAEVFPNPVTENANLILPQKVTVDLYLYSGSGEVYWVKQNYTTSKGEVTIPMDQLSRGWYLLHIDYGNYIETKKLLKE